MMLKADDIYTLNKILFRFCVGIVEQLDACNLVDEEHYSSVAFHIVVGAGIIGSWAAWHLQKSGCKTVLIDSFPLPHTRGEVTRLKTRL